MQFAAAEPTTSVLTNIQLAHFDPIEAEKITGVMRSLQRQWRVRGHLPGAPGHALFSVFELGQMLCLRLFGQSRRDLSLVRDAALAAANAVAWRALGPTEVWCGDHQEVGTWDREWTARVAARADGGWHYRASMLRTLIFDAKGLKPVKQQFCVLWADNTHSFTNDLHNATATAGGARAGDKMFAINVQSAGFALAALAGRPLAFCELEVNR